MMDLIQVVCYYEAINNILLFTSEVYHVT